MTTVGCQWCGESLSSMLLWMQPKRPLSMFVPQVPTLTLWGRQDEVIPPATAVPKLVDALPMAQFRWVETCGHTPHLEQPAFTADAIVAFINDMPVPGDADVSDVVQAAAGRAAARQAITDAAVTVADGATTFAKEALEKARAAVSSLGK